MKPKTRKAVRQLSGNKFQLSEWMRGRKADCTFVTPAVASIARHPASRTVYTGTNTGLILTWTETGSHLRTTSVVGDGEDAIVHQILLAGDRIMFACVSEDGYAGPGSLKARRGQIRAFFQARSGADIQETTGLVQLGCWRHQYGARPCAWQPSRGPGGAVPTIPPSPCRKARTCCTQAAVDT